MADVSQRENILISSVGQRQVLVALPENPTAGGAHGYFPKTPGVTVEPYRNVPNNLDNGFSQISVYQVTLNPDAQMADQRFTLQQETHPVNVLINGTIHMEASWDPQQEANRDLTMESIQAVIPQNGLNGQPLPVAVQQNASTGYHWVSATYGQLQVSSHLYPPEESTKIGPPALELYNISPTAPNSDSTFQLQQMSPAGQNTGCINVNIVSRSSNQ